MNNTILDALAPASVGVKTVPTESLRPNPHNPRLLFDRAPHATLKDSIDKVGILVPLTVYWSQRDKQFVILDGQRRWICAQELGLKEVPVNQIAEPSLVQNIVIMFQIHKLREDWELMPTALKLEVLMKSLEEKRDKTLAELTGLDQAVVSRCKKLLSFSRKWQDLMLDADPARRVKADFFIELYAVRNDRVVNKMAWFSRETFTKRMLEKYQMKGSGLKSVTDFRLIKQHINNASRAGKIREITRLLREFTEDDNLSPEHLMMKSADVSADSRKLVASVNKLLEAIGKIDVREFYGEEELWKSLEGLMKLIQMKLRDAGRRLQD